jgi:hypothetical protein
VVFTIPKMLRIFFKFKRRFLGDLCRCAVRALLVYFQAATGKTLEPGVVAVIQTFGDRINFHPHLHFLVTEGGVDEAGVFQRKSSFDDARLAEVFARVVLRFLVGRELLLRSLSAGKVGIPKQHSPDEVNRGSSYLLTCYLKKMMIVLEDS